MDNVGIRLSALVELVKFSINFTRKNGSRGECLA